MKYKLMRASHELDVNVNTCFDGNHDLIKPLDLSALRPGARCCAHVVFAFLLVENVHDDDRDVAADDADENGD